MVGKAVAFAVVAWRDVLRSKLVWKGEVGNSRFFFAVNVLDEIAARDMGAHLAGVEDVAYIEADKGVVFEQGFFDAGINPVHRAVGALSDGRGRLVVRCDLNLHVFPYRHIRHYLERPAKPVGVYSGLQIISVEEWLEEVKAWNHIPPFEEIVFWNELNAIARLPGEVFKRGGGASVMMNILDLLNDIISLALIPV